MKRQVYIFRGAPASGKGAVVPQFAKLLPKPVALIEQDKLRWGIHLIGRATEEVTPSEHRMAYENTLFLYERYLRAGNYTIVVEGLFSWDDEQSNEGAVRHFIELANKYDFNVTSIVLKADKNILMERNRERPSFTTPENEFNTLYKNVYDTIDNSETVIDSTSKSVEDTMNELKRLIHV